MTFFKTALAAVTFSTLLVSTMTQANDMCQLELSTGIALNTNTLAFIEDKGETVVDNQDNTNANSQVTPVVPPQAKVTLYEIIGGKTLIVDGRSIALTSSQKTLVNQYDTNIRQLVPEVKQVALEGIDSAIEGVNISFNDLLGEGNAVAVNIIKELMLIRQQVTNNLVIENGIYIGADGLESEELLGKNFEQRIKTRIQKAVINSMGNIMMILGQRMLSGEGNAESFDVQLSKFRKKIEYEIDSRTLEIEEKSQVLCQRIIEVDKVEGKLMASIKPLADINVFTVK